MNSIMRFRKLSYVVVPMKCSSLGFQSFFESPNIDHNKNEDEKEKEKEKRQKQNNKKKGFWKRQNKKWRCIVDHYFLMIGYAYITWWLLSFLYWLVPVALAGFQVQEESPGVSLSRKGVTGIHPIVLVPGIVTGGLELWEGRPCAEGLFRKRLWGCSFAEIFKRPLCWLEHLSLDNETGLDPPGIRVRPVPGLSADNFASGYHSWELLIENLAKIGYDGKNLYMASYDWRLSFQNTEVRDQALSRLKSKIELLFLTNGYKKVVVVPQSMGAIYFLHFLKWVEAPSPMGGGGGPGWCDKHIKAIMNISPLFLGVPKAVRNVFSAEGNDVSFVRAAASGFINLDYLGLQMIEHVMRVCRTWDSIISLMPKGGETIWGDLDWSPEERNNNCDQVNKRYVKHLVSEKTYNGSDMKNQPMKYGRMISFGKEISELPASVFTAIDSDEFQRKTNSGKLNSSSEDVWTEYDEMSRESIQKVAKENLNTARTVFDLLNCVAPKMMKRAKAHFSHGIADDLDDPKYAHYKYWSNPLETKLPDAPDMEIYCLYGVGIPTERSHVHKLSTPENKTITFQIDPSADGEQGNTCLQNGDESVPVVSAGFMCTKGWRGRTRFNPSGMATYVREYRQRHGSVLDGRELESGGGSNIMGNVAFVEDVLRVAAGASGVDIGGDRIVSDIIKISQSINLKL